MIIGVSALRREEGFSLFFFFTSFRIGFFWHSRTGRFRNLIVVSKSMKTSILSLLLILGLVGLASCKKRQVRKIESSVTEGTWRITQYTDDGVDETSDFNGDVFTFMDDGTLLVTGTHEATGTWSVDRESNDDSGGRHIEFRISLPPPGLDELSDDWEVESHSDSRLELKDDSGNDENGEDFLTFSQN